MSNKPRELARVQPKLLRVIQELVAGKAPWPLFLRGLQGRGKSSAALALLDHVQVGAFLTPDDLQNLICRSWNNGPAMNWDALAHNRSQLVILDQVGAGSKASDTKLAAANTLLDIRETYPLILISNFTTDEIAATYDATFASRCGAGTDFELIDVDRRIV